MKKKIKEEWISKFEEKISTVHKRNKSAKISKILKRAITVKNSLVSRSKKSGVECTITVEELREMMYAAYGQKCKYCDKILTIDNMVIDHIIPISRGGTSNRENLQIICKTSNSMKGSLMESDYKILLDWLDSVSEELKKDITIRLSRGIH
jgi:5-methylcytosine-specific restriction endonuclease McrA